MVFSNVPTLIPLSTYCNNSVLRLYRESTRFVINANHFFSRSLGAWVASTRAHPIAGDRCRNTRRRRATGPLGGRTRARVFLIRPPTARGPSPVVFVLHGGAVGDGRQTFRYGFQELGARDGVVTVHPSGIGSCESRRQLSAASSGSGALRCVPRVHRVQLHHARLPRRRRPAALFFVWCGVQLLPDVQKCD